MEVRNDELIHFSEFGEKRLLRQFDLPTCIDPDRITATVDEGILRIVAKRLEFIAIISLAWSRRKLKLLGSSRLDMLPRRCTGPSATGTFHVLRTAWQVASRVLINRRRKCQALNTYFFR